jgi:hypothetical protein
MEDTKEFNFIQPHKAKTFIIPCSIGDEVWGLRPYKDMRIPTKGVVSEILFVGTDMRVCIVVKNIVRGTWGVNVFATKEEAMMEATKFNNAL